MCIEWKLTCFVSVTGSKPLEFWIALRSCYRPGFGIAIVLTNQRCTSLRTYREAV
jgi:hypothetical protein